MAGDALKQFIEENSKVFRKYKKYINDNTWVDDSGKEKYDNLELETALVKSVIDRLKVFAKRFSNQLTDSSSKKFIELSLSAIRLHSGRIDQYLATHDWASFDDKQSELKFQDTLFAKKSWIDDQLQPLNLEGDTKQGITFFMGQIATIPLHNLLTRDGNFPEILEYEVVKKVDWDRKPKDEMFINIPNPPKYNAQLHYWEQKEETLQFYIDEYNKIKNGIDVDGVHISGWLYFHLNFFKTPIPHGKDKDIIMCPPLRDNEWFIDRDITRANKGNKIMLIASSRRMAKSTTMASRLHYKALVIDLAELMVVSGSATDLGQLIKNIKTSLENINPAFSLIVTAGADFDGETTLGIKKSQQRTERKATLKIVNLVKGQNLSSELLAGFTPHEFILDEAFKFHFRESLEALKPALATTDGWRTSPLISSTGGNADLSRDGLAMLKNPEENDLLLMDWDYFESFVPQEEITWKRVPFGTFFPAQMSMYPGGGGIRKVKTNLAEFLKKPNAKGLSQIEINVTDWKEAKRIINEERNRKKADSMVLTKEKVYYPIDTEEIFLSGKTNPFPVAGIRKWLDELLAEQGEGKKVELFRKKDGTIGYELSDKELAKFPHKGGFVDAPIVLYVNELPTNPADDLYVASCLPPGEMVYTEKGLMNIEEVTLDNKLINKDGKLVDIKKLKKFYKEDEDVYTVKVGSTLRTTTFTGEHPIYSSRPDYYTTEKSMGRTLQFNFDKTKFIEAKDLQIGDWIKYPNIYRAKNDFDIDTLWKEEYGKNGFRADSPLKDEDFWLFVGTYLGDGWVCNYSEKIGISFNRNETKHISLNDNIIKKLFNRHPTIWDKDSGQVKQMDFSHRQLARFLKDNFGEKAHGKFLPEWVKKLDDRFKYKLINGYLNSDGAVFNLPNGYIVSKFVSISLRMLEDFQDILFSLGIVSSITKLRDEQYQYVTNTEKKSHIKETYMLQLSHIDTLKLFDGMGYEHTEKLPKLKRELKNPIKSKRKCFISEDMEHIYFRVKEITKEKYSGYVYNFECDTNTFLTHHITTHNCDDYKQEQSDTDSVGSLHIIKRNSILDDDGDTIVASLATRPDPKREWHRQWLMLMEAFNAKCLMENEDMEFKTYLDPLHLTEKWLVPGENLSNVFSLNYTARRTIGVTPTPKNKRIWIGMAIQYTRDEVEVTDEKTGEKRVVEGYRRIKDVRLLEEMLAYNETGNFDRITSFGIGLVYKNYLDTTYQMPKTHATRTIYADRTSRRDSSKPKLYTSNRYNPYR